MKKFGIVIATVIVMALTGCSSKESGAATTEALKIATKADADIATTEEVKEAKKDKDTKKTTEEKTEKSEKTTESVAQTTAVTPVQQTSSQSSASTQQPAPVTTQAPAPVTTEAPKPTTTQAPVTTEALAPVHQHTWATREEVVTAAWTETVEHPAVTHNERWERCNYCGQLFNGTDIYAHQDQYEETDVEHTIAGYSTSTKTVVDQEAWTEIIEHPAVTKTVEYCTGCGATR